MRAVVEYVSDEIRRSAKSPLDAGYDFFVDFLPDSANSPFSGTITIKTVTRRVQPMPNIIKDFILGNLRDNAALTDFNFGEEFNDVKTRKMIIGGKQQRLYQAVTSTFSTLQHRAVWDPTTNTFARRRSIHALI